MDEVKGFIEQQVEKNLIKDVLSDVRPKSAKIDLAQAHSEEDLNNKKDKRAMRKYYAVSTFVLTCFWLGMVLLIVFLTGWRARGFSLTQAELITLLSTTTANILGVLLIIMAYIYKD